MFTLSPSANFFPPSSRARRPLPRPRAAPAGLLCTSAMLNNSANPNKYFGKFCTFGDKLIRNMEIHFKFHHTGLTIDIKGVLLVLLTISCG